eukprot:UN27768
MALRLLERIGVGRSCQQKLPPYKLRKNGDHKDIWNKMPKILDINYYDYYGEINSEYLQTLVKKYMKKEGVKKINEAEVKEACDHCQNYYQGCSYNERYPGSCYKTIGLVEIGAWIALVSRELI